LVQSFRDGGEQCIELAEGVASRVLTGFR